MLPVLGGVLEGEVDEQERPSQNPVLSDVASAQRSVAAVHPS
jgi:hypothetical protein